MAEPIRFHLDEHVAAAVATGLRRRGVDVTTTAEAGLLGVDDEEQLAFARSEHRVIVTHDGDFLTLAARGIAHPGICYCHQHARTVRQMVEMLTILFECFDAEEMENRIEYL
jgi:predicted nuclease of predicted toxin-antitoxin system